MDICLIPAKVLFLNHYLQPQYVCFLSPPLCGSVFLFHQTLTLLRDSEDDCFQEKWWFILLNQHSTIVDRIINMSISYWREVDIIHLSLKLIFWLIFWCCFVSPLLHEMLPFTCGLNKSDTLLIYLYLHFTPHLFLTFYSFDLKINFHGCKRQIWMCLMLILCNWILKLWEIFIFFFFEFSYVRNNCDKDICACHRGKEDHQFRVMACMCWTIGFLTSCWKSCGLLSSRTQWASMFFMP